MEVTKSFQKSIFVSLFLLIFVNGKSIHLESGNCGKVIVKDNGKSETIPISKIPGDTLKEFITNHEHWKITSIAVKTGLLFRMCSTTNCSTFNENDHEIAPELQDIDNETISAECYIPQKLTKSPSCSDASTEIMTKDCARLYRSKSCNGTLPYETIKANERKRYSDMFESLAVRPNCDVTIKHSGRVDSANPLEDNLFPIYKRYKNPHPKEITFTCTCY